MLNIAVTNPELQQFIEEQIQAGTYHSPDEVVAAGLTLLRHDPDTDLAPEELEGLRHEIGIGLEQADRGDFANFTAEDIIAEGTKHLQNRNHG